MSKCNLTELVSVRTLEKILDNFTSATGLGCTIRDMKGIPLTKAGNATRLWQEVIKNPEVEKKHTEMMLQLFEKISKTGQNEIYLCYLDTYAFAVPIYIEGRPVAFFVGGLGRFGNPDIAVCIEEAARINMDADSFLEMYLMLPLVNHEKLESCANLLRIIGSTVSSLAKEGTEAKAKLEELSEIQEFLEAKIQKNSRELHESEERYKRLFDTINDGVYLTDEKGIIININLKGAKLLGYDAPTDVIGLNLRDFYADPADRDELTRILYWKEKIEHFRPHIRLKNGEKTYIETNSAVIKDRNGKITGVQGIFNIPYSHAHSGITKYQQDKANNDLEPAPLNQTENHQKPLKASRRVGSQNR